MEHEKIMRVKVVVEDENGPPPLPEDWDHLGKSVDDLLVGSLHGWVGNLKFIEWEKQ